MGIGARFSGDVGPPEDILTPRENQERISPYRLSAPGRRHSWRCLSFASLTVFIAAACDTTPAYLKRDIQEGRLAEIGLETVDPSANSSAAGTSFLLEIDVPPMDNRRIGADTASEGFHRYVHRCGTCHSAPSPRARTAAEWGYVFPNMKRHMTDAGLIPLGARDQALILDFLQRHAGNR
jgi:hypothetical protein